MKNTILALQAVLASLAYFEKLHFFCENREIFPFYGKFPKKMLLPQVVARVVPKDAEFNGEYEKYIKISNLKVIYV